MGGTLAAEELGRQAAAAGTTEDLEVEEAAEGPNREGEAAEDRTTS